MLDMHELYWAAGFLEGEGSFTPNAKRNSCQISAPQVEREPLLRLQALMGGNLTLRFEHEKRKGRRSCRWIWRWEMSGKDAAAWMMTLWSLMSAKRRAQIEKAISAWKSVPLHATVKVMKRCRKGHDLSGSDGFMARAKDGPDGFRLRCKVCQRAFRDAWNPVRAAKRREAYAALRQELGAVEATRLRDRRS